MFIHDSEEAKNINTFLSRQNKIPLTSIPMFRLVWSDDQREIRIGEFNEYVGPIFLRTYKGAKEVQKYPFIQQRWVLEQWYPPAIAYSEEIPNSKHGSFEPIYVFEDSNFNPLPLRLDVIQLILNHINRPVRGERARRDAMKNEKEEQEERQYKFDFDVLNDESYLVSQLHSGSAGLVPPEYFGDSPNLKNKTN